MSAGGYTRARRAIAASIAGARRRALACTCASSRSTNSGSTSLPKISIASMMCSWRLRPAWRTKITWSTPASSHRPLPKRPQGLTGLGRRADAAAQAAGVAGGLLAPEPLRLDTGAHGRDDRVGVVALRGAALDELRPHVALGRLVLTEDVVVAERVAEEVGA